MTFSALWNGLTLALDAVPPSEARQPFDFKTAGVLMKHGMWSAEVGGVANAPRSEDGTFMAARHSLTLFVHHANRPLLNEQSVLDAVADLERTLLALYQSVPFNTGFIINLDNWRGPTPVTSDGDYLQSRMAITAVDRYDLTLSPA